jgi:hypothetical protein
MTCQDGLTEREEDERSGGSVWMPARQKSREVEGQVWVMSMTGKKGKGSQWVTGEQGKGSEIVTKECREGIDGNEHD